MKKRLLLVFFGLFFSLILLEAGLRLGGFIYNSRQEIRNREELKKKKQVYRILCLGESTTQGEYPKYLEEVLNNRDIGIRFSVIDKGRQATTTTFILAKLEEDLDKYKPDMVITMIGVNDDRTDMVYEYENGGIKSLIKSIKIYKLARLLEQHIKRRIEELSTIKGNIKQNRVEEINELSSKKLLEAKGKESGNKIVGTHADNEVKYAQEWSFCSEKEEPILKKTIESDPNNKNKYIELVKFYIESGKYGKAMSVSKKLIALNPIDKLGYFYLMRIKQYVKEESKYRKAIQINPKDQEANLKLGHFYERIGSSNEAEKIYEKAIKSGVNNESIYSRLANCYRRENKYEEAMAMYKKAIELNPEKIMLFYLLEEIYRKQGKGKEAEEIMNKIVDKGKGPLRIKYLRPNEGYESEYFGRPVIYNYKKLSGVLKKRGIRYICMQYPLRKIGILRNIFYKDKDIVFVDNEKIFTDVVQKEGYDEYFRDIFAGDFGHCTIKGNKLLAKNIADTIIKEVFHK
ncbi:MAG: tetratricopeptide repeat protein [Elusimicrobia bacterium]|nr:tetratricopeptide repeat protein [Candidatus Liberimonas magnetica]